MNEGSLRDNVPQAGLGGSPAFPSRSDMNAVWAQTA